MRCNVADELVSHEVNFSSATLENDVPLLKLSSKRLVNSVSSQTSSNIKISNEISTQTDDNYIDQSKHIVYNV